MLQNPVTWIQEPPLHPVAQFEFYGTLEPEEVKAILDFLMSKDLPEQMSFSIDSNLYCFHTTHERYQWAIGFRQAWNLRKQE